MHESRHGTAVSSQLPELKSVSPKSHAALTKKNAGTITFTLLLAMLLLNVRSRNTMPSPISA